MAPRSNLHVIFEEITTNVYYQPPRNVEMVYPCIVYRLDQADTRHADNRPYTVTKQYDVTLITRDADDVRFDKVAHISTARHDRSFVADNLYHHVFSIYF